MHRNSVLVGPSHGGSGRIDGRVNDISNDGDDDGGNASGGVSNDSDAVSGTLPAHGNGRRCVSER